MTDKQEPQDESKQEVEKPAEQKKMDGTLHLPKRPLTQEKLDALAQKFKRG